MASLIERVPPHNDEAEQAVLASLMVDSSIFPAIRDQLDPADFYHKRHQTIFEAIIKLVEAGNPPDLIGLRDTLGAHLDAIGGYDYLLDLGGMVPTTAHAAYYAEIVARKATLRGLIRAGSDVVALAFGEEEPEIIIDQAERAILSASKRTGRVELADMYDDTMAVLASVEKRAESPGTILGTPTGFYDLDFKLSGLCRSDLLILAARPAMGKTSISLNLCRNVALDQGLPVLIFSLEMSKGQLIERLIAAEAEVDLSRFRNGKLTTDEWKCVMEATHRIANAPIFIHDDGGITIQEARSVARRAKAKHPALALIMVDYIQLMSVAGTKGDNRVQDVGTISRGLKQMSRELNLTTLALSQLSRAVESRQDKRPMLSDLRESGSLEQDADIVLFIYRDDYYNENSDSKHQAEVIIAKHRNGPIGTIHLYFRAELTKFENLTFERTETRE